MVTRPIYEFQENLFTKTVDICETFHIVGGFFSSGSNEICKIEGIFLIEVIFRNKKHLQRKFVNTLTQFSFVFKVFPNYYMMSNFYDRLIY